LRPAQPDKPTHAARPRFPTADAACTAGKGTGAEAAEGLERMRRAKTKLRMVLGRSATPDARDPGIAARRAADAGRDIAFVPLHGRVWPIAEWSLRGVRRRQADTRSCKMSTAGNDPLSSMPATNRIVAEGSNYAVRRVRVNNADAPERITRECSNWPRCHLPGLPKLGRWYSLGRRREDTVSDAIEGDHTK
jgi:hypothetical protein